jgi:hypothetical protein
MIDNQAIIRELAIIRQANNGIVQPAAVVEFARNPETALHSRFEWDDSEAAEQYRLWQARHLLRVYVTVVGSEPEPIKAHVSLISDRNESGGYRYIGDVLNSPSLRAELLRTALRELEAFRSKYHRLKELSDVFAAIDAVSKSDKVAV